MRDPQARLEFTEKLVFRHLLQNLPENHVLFSGVANEWVQENLLIKFTWRSTHLLESPRIAFVSSPEEWSNQQLYDAALLTLQLLEKANLANSDLKDASAWNIVFDGCKPKFCDLTSFTPLDEKNWWAGGQFVRHFISPLWLARENGFQARDFFRISRDGVLPEIVQKALGLRRFFSRCWPLVASAQSKAIPTKNSETSKEDILIFRKQLLISLNWMLKGVRPVSKSTTIWADYTKKRDHYSENSLLQKRDQVLIWLHQIKPEWTLDLGCNSGEFTQLALEAGSKVIAVDSDHDAIQSLYRKCRGEEGIYPIVAALDDLHSGRGWAGTEHTGLIERLKECADIVLMLALIHHLSIASSVHIDQVAKFAAACTRRWLIVEFIEPHDPQVVLLCKQRQRNLQEFSLEIQTNAFVSAGFIERNKVTLPDGNRHLLLLEKKF